MRVGEGLLRVFSKIETVGSVRWKGIVLVIVVEL